MIRKQRLRTALLSSSYNFQYLGEIYKSLAFDSSNFPFRKKDYADHSLNTWGVSEEILVPETSKVLEAVPLEEPLYMMYLNQATHHPYSVPKGFKTPYSDSNNLARYRAAQFFTDSVFGEILDLWRKSGRLANTLLLDSGDHGESFGTIHPQNRLHRDFLFEENVRNFLYIVDFRQPPSGFQVSRRQGMLGDAIPTLVDLLGGPPPKSPGQSLVTPQESKRIHYFHKFGIPERWGLVDGDWKFLIDANGLLHPQLYELGSDPNEHTNVALKYPHHVREYTALVAEWFLRSQENFNELLQGFPKASKDLNLSQHLKPGPRKLHLGRWTRGKRFKSGAKLYPDSSLGAMVEGAPYAETVVLRFLFESPRGKVYRYRKKIAAGRSTYGVRLKTRGKPLARGKWIVSIYRDTQKLLQSSIRVLRSKPSKRKP